MADGVLGLTPLGQVPLGGLEPADSGIVDPEVLRFASRWVSTRPGDEPANTPYAGLLTQPLFLRRSAVGVDTPVGQIGAGAAEVELWNGDGALDDLAGASAIGGRAIRVRALPVAGGVHRPLGEARTLFEGVMVRADIDRDRLRILAATRLALLDRPLNDAFAGTGGAEGGADLAGQQYPTALGRQLGVSPVYLGVIGGKETYRVAGGRSLPIQGVSAFYDQGRALDKVAGSPGAGEFSDDPATGLVTLGGVRAAAPTCDVDGYAPGGAWAAGAAAIVEALLVDFGGVANARLDGYAFQVLAGDEPATVGLWAGPREDASVRAAVAAFLRGGHILGGFDRLDRFTVAALKPPGGAIRAVLDRTNLIGLERLSPPAALDPPAWRHEVGWGFNPTVTTDVSTAAGEAQAKFMASAWRVAAASDPAILARNLNSGTFFTPGRYAAQADAAAKAAALVGLYDGRALWRAELHNISPDLDLGQTVELRPGRFQLDGKLGTIVGVELDAAGGAMALEVFA